MDWLESTTKALSETHGQSPIHFLSRCETGCGFPMMQPKVLIAGLIRTSNQSCSTYDGLSITYNHGSSNDGLRAGQVDHFVCDTDFGDTVFASGDITKVPHVPLCILWGAVLFVEGVKVGSSTGTAYKEITKGQMPTRISVRTSLFNFFWKSRVNHVRQSSSVNFPQTNQILTNNQHNVL